MDAGDGDRERERNERREQGREGSLASLPPGLAVWSELISAMSASHRNEKTEEQNWVHFRDKKWKARRRNSSKSTGALWSALHWG